MATPLRVNRRTSAIIIFLTTTLGARVSSIGNAADDHESLSLVVELTTDDVFFEIVHPPELSYTYRIRPALDFGTPFNASLSSEKMALVPVEPEMGCSESENKEALRGNVALVSRGDCTFFQKSVVAERAGARAIIIADYHTKSIDEERESPMWMDYHYIEMTKDGNAENNRKVNISAGFLLGKNGRMIINTLKKLNLPHALIKIPINMTFTPLKDFHQPPWVVL